jgi:hypothetical protein
MGLKCETRRNCSFCKSLRQEKDRNYRRLKRKLEQTDHSIKTFENQASTLCTIPEPLTDCEPIKTFFYGVPLKLDSEIFAS